MTNPRTVARRGHAFAVTAGMLTDRLARTIDTLSAAQNERDGFGSTAGSLDGVRGGQRTISVPYDDGGGAIGVDLVPVTGVEAAALAPASRAAADLDDLDGLLADIGRAINQALDICDRYAVGLTDVDRRRLRCIGTGEAVGRICTQWADLGRSDGRCLDCGPAAERARDSERRRSRRHAS